MIANHIDQYLFAAQKVSTRDPAPVIDPSYPYFAVFRQFVVGGTITTIEFQISNNGSGGNACWMADGY